MNEPSSITTGSRQSEDAGTTLPSVTAPAANNTPARSGSGNTAPTVAQKTGTQHSPTVDAGITGLLDCG